MQYIWVLKINYTNKKFVSTSFTTEYDCLNDLFKWIKLRQSDPVLSGFYPDDVNNFLSRIKSDPRYEVSIRSNSQ